MSTLSPLLLIALLGGGSSPAPPTRLALFARLLDGEDHRSADRGAVQAALRDSDRALRRRAALAAGRIGDPALVPVLIEHMNDPEPEVRQMSAFALGLIGSPSAVDRLLLSLKDPIAVVRGRAAEALGRIGDKRAALEIAQALISATPSSATVLAIRGDDAASATDPWIELRLELFALARLKDVTAAARALLLPSGEARFDWWAATDAAMSIESPSLKPALVAAAGSSDAVSRTFAARGLGALKDASTLDVLGRLLRDRDEGVVVSALRAVAAIADERGVALIGAMRPTGAALAEEWLRALTALPPDRRLRPVLMSFVAHNDPAVRGAAMRALARVDREEFALVLSGLDPDPVWFVRADLAAALGGLGDEVSVGILFSMLEDADPRVVASVLDALAKARGADAVETLRRYLDHADPAVRMAAIDGLTKLKIPLGSRAVRLRAMASLQSPTEPALSPGVQDVDRPFLDYLDAMEPFASRAERKLYTPRAILHTARGEVEIHLNVVEAPLASSAFIDLARRGFYDGSSFHRVVPTDIVQGGDPRGDGRGGPGFAMRSEVGQKPFGRGVVGIVLAGRRDTGGSQFFVTLAPTPQFDGECTVLGWVAKGMDVVDRIRPGDTIEHVEIWTGR